MKQEKGGKKCDCYNYQSSSVLIITYCEAEVNYQNIRLAQLIHQGLFIYNLGTKWSGDGLYPTRCIKLHSCIRVMEVVNIRVCYCV